MFDRYQRGIAHSIMRMHNEAFSLSNPTPWHMEASQSIKQAAKWAKRLMLPRKKEPLRVSWKYEKCTA